MVIQALENKAILNKTAFCDTKVVIPPLPVQQRIAGILSAYDELIECVWGYEHYEKIQNNTVAALVSSLRHKLDVISAGAGKRQRG